MFRDRRRLAAVEAMPAAAAVRIAACLGAVLTTATVAIAQPQPPDPAPAIEAVKQLAFLEGSWTGEGWIQMGPGAREEFTQTEDVKTTLDGAVMVIEGIGHSKEATPRKIHHAMGIVSYDPTQKKLGFTSFVAGRPRLDAEAVASPGKLVWSFSPPGSGQVRYTIDVADGEWHEIGEFSRDGQQWGQFFEMRLRRQ